MAYAQDTAVAGLTVALNRDGPGGFDYTNNILVVVALHNVGATSATFTWKRGGVIATSIGGNYDCTIVNTLPVSGSNPRPSFTQTTSQSEAYSYTVSAGATVIIPFRLTIFSPKWGGSGFAGYSYPDVNVWSGTIPYFEGATAKSASFSLGMTANDAGGSPPSVGYTGTDHATFGGVEKPLWATINLNVPPPSGSITISGAALGLNGAGKTEIQIKVGVNHTWQKMAERTTTGGTPGASMTNLVWTTTSPNLYDGLEYRMLLNGGQVKTGEIGLDAYGNFAITFDVSAVQMEGVADPILDDDGEMLPTAPDVVPGPDPAHDPRPDPVPVNSLGTDPQSDTATNSTVKDEYRAVRAAVEDALQVPNPGQFDFASWERDVRNAESEPGEDVGTFASSTVGALIGLGGTGPNLGTLPSGSPAITLHNGGGSVIGSIGAMSYASSVRGVAVIFLSIFYLLAVIAVVRSGFAGS